jgi:PAS domain S-box-containing protein
MPDAFALHEIILDAQGQARDYRFLAVNPGFERHTGLRAENVLGRTALEIFPNLDSDLIAAYGRIALDGASDSFCFHHRDQGKYYTVRAFSPIRGRFVTIFADTTALALADETLRASEKRFRHLFHAAKVPLCHITKDGRIADVNDRFTQIFGYTRDDLPTLREWWEAAYPDPVYRNFAMSTWARDVAEGGGSAHELEREFQITCKNGTMRTMLISGTPLDDDYLATFIDLTERKREEEEVILARDQAEAITVALTYISTYIRLIRNNMLENMKEDYVLYANVRGLKQSTILVRHILKNSLHTCIVAIGMSVPQLMAGTIVVENVFAWPGLGKLCIASIFNRDYPVIQTYVLLIGTLFVVFNLLFDIIQSIADPRLRREVS